ncbi:MAG: hypothetical protein ACE147_02270 [Candidatus Methylomirabilales bacterium]
MVVERLGPPCPVRRLARGIYRYEARLSGAPDARWSQVFRRRLRPAVAWVVGDRVIFEARGEEFPDWLARLDAGLRAANELGRGAEGRNGERAA